jgi:membrane protease YdiL (CAAX protease family)
MNQNESQDSPEKTASESRQDKNQTTVDVSMKVPRWVAIFVALSWSAVGPLLCMVLEKLLDIDLSTIVSSIISLLVSAGGAFFLFPKIYHAPFGPVPVKQYLKRLGFYLPVRAWRHVVLGIALAGCTLSGMFVASLLTGRYVADWATINLGHIIFSLNPGIFEEIFYRGILMMLLLPMTKSLKKATIGQVVIFGLAHIKGFDWGTLIDVISVMVLALAFTYTAYKTRNLLAGIVFHFLHDAFLFFVQVPEGVYNGLQENLLFYGMLWLMVGVGCGIIWYATQRLNVCGESELYGAN